MMNKMEMMNMDKKMIEIDLMYVENQLNDLKRFLAEETEVTEEEVKMEDALKAEEVK